jgi:competence protein ComEC
MAIPAGGLLAGCAAGICWPDLPVAPLVALLIASAVAVAGTLASSQDALFAAAIASGFASGGALLSCDAWRDAWRPPLRVAFESMVRDQGMAAVYRADRAPPEDAGLQVVLAGELRADASPTPAGVSLRVAVRGIEAVQSVGRPSDPANARPLGDVLLTVGGSLAAERIVEWRAGRSIQTTAQLHRPARYLNHGVPDHERALARRGVTLVGSVKSGALVDVVRRGHPAAEAAAWLRAFTRRALASAVGRWSVQSQGIVTAILIGDRSGLDAGVERRLQEAGTYHVIAISGGNIAILAGLMLFGFRAAGIMGRTAMLTAIGGLAAYGYTVGGGESVDRATLMAVVFFFARALDLRAPPLNTVALAAGVLVAIEPLAIGDPGFLLTAGATAAILLAAETKPLGRVPRLVVPLAALFIASAAAEAALFPIAASFFSRVTFAGLALNFLAIPLMAVAQMAGMLAVAVIFLSPTAAAGAGWIAHLAAEGLVRTADIVEVAPFATWRVAPPSAHVLAAYYGAGAVAWMLWRRRAHGPAAAESARTRTVRRGCVAAAALAALWILAEPWTFVASEGDGRLHLTFLDVGQGDAALVRFPRGTALLVDAGGLSGSPTFDIGDRVVAPVLRALGVRRLEVIALTHGDADHVGGAEAGIREFRPREIWEGIPVPQSPALQRLAIAAAAAGSAWRNVQADDAVRIDDVSVVVRHPGQPDWERQDVRNDDSIVLELLWRDVSIVLTGDIGREAEGAIVPRFPRVPLRVVKVPHHGSLTSSTDAFVRTLAPRVAVVSAGRRNAFGHPAPAVIGRYRAAGVEIFRTDQDGAVMVDTDGTSLDIRTFTGRKLSISSHQSHEGTKTRRHEVTD